MTCRHHWRRHRLGLRDRLPLRARRLAPIRLVVLAAVVTLAAAAVGAVLCRHRLRLRDALLNGAHHRVGAEGVVVGAGEADGAAGGDVGQGDVGREVELARQGGEDLRLLGRVGGRADAHQHVEPARPEERRLEKVWPVGGAEHEEVAPRVDAVELRHELRDDAVHHAAGVRRRAARGRERVDLVEEEDAGRGGGGAGEELAHAPLALADVRRD
mmetsp:Transcript_37069/g.124188  ORF Transcript_37069/g.124188 Transcript_37069/m.124188 type:complete len:214 (-) Transcript_37069:464-1105(-)